MKYDIKPTRDLIDTAMGRKACGPGFTKRYMGLCAIRRIRAQYGHCHQGRPDRLRGSGCQPHDQERHAGNQC